LDPGPAFMSGYPLLSGALSGGLGDCGAAENGDF